MSRPYSRIYWEVMEDEKFDGIREDPRLFGCWSLLLVAADMAYPVPAYIPPTIPRSSFRRLVDAGLVDELAGHRFRVHGLETERSMRSDSARNAAALRWQSKGNAETMPSKDKAETRAKATVPSIADAPDDDGRADLEAFLLVTRRAPTPKQRKVLDDVLRYRDVSGAQWAADIILRHPDDPIGAVIEADRQWREERIAEAKRQERPKPSVKRKAGLPQLTRDILAEMQRIDAEKAVPQ